MGILEFLSKEKRHERWMRKQVGRANNKHTPKDYRQIALQNVIEHGKRGDQIALSGMVSRFAVIAEPTIEDEREKEWVCEALIEIGDAALPQIQRAMRSAESVSWVHRALRGIVSAEEFKSELLDVLSDFDTEYERNPDRKIQTIMALADVHEPDVLEALVRFLEDVDETVRFQTVMALVEQENEIAREALLKAMCEDESIRLRNEIVDAFARLGWSVTGQKKKVPAILPEGYRLDKSGRIVKLGSSE